MEEKTWPTKGVDRVWLLAVEKGREKGEGLS